MIDKNKIQRKYVLHYVLIKGYMHSLKQEAIQCILSPWKILYLLCNTW